VGKIPNPTQPSDLNLKTERTQPKYQKGVVKRPQITAQLLPVSVQPQDNKNPFYVKLRVEVESSVIGEGQGTVYLGFHLDPIHQVHWNNLAAPLNYEITGLTQGKLSPAKDSFPKVEVESDLDPREFLLDASSLEKNGSFKVKVKYFACSDLEGWCKPVTQEYQVQLQSDRDAGKARRSGSRNFAGGGRGFRGGGSGNFRGGGFRGDRFGADRFERGGRPNMSRPQGRGGFSVERLMSHDKNNDGKITREEFPEKFNRIINRADLNGDQAIDKEEAEKMMERMKQRDGK
ncbi:MAG: EF-hand domain-containing protein, partial [Planctomycetota bacterium]|nr:EF-hand domain-containing protein [Planctomycetota bacterium]